MEAAATQLGYSDISNAEQSNRILGARQTKAAAEVGAKHSGISVRALKHKTQPKLISSFPSNCLAPPSLPSAVIHTAPSSKITPDRLRSWDPAHRMAAIRLVGQRAQAAGEADEAFVP